MVTQEPLLNQLVSYLDLERRRILDAPQDSHVLEFSRRQLEEVRQAFARMILRGEGRLHKFCELLCESLLASRYSLQSVAVGQVFTSQERFTLVQNISTQDLYSHTDLDLGSRQLERLRFLDGQGWSQAVLVANFVEYEANEANEFGIHKFISRIKAEEEIWNKVVDEIFEIDGLVRRDKQLRHLGPYVKDIFGVKVVVADDEGARRVQSALQTVEWSGPELARHGVPDEPAAHCLRVLEKKDYLTPGGKASGWRALKSVVHWWGTTIEIQVQPLRNFYRERERLTRESHAEFKFRREALRNQIAQAVPLFRFYRDLLRWLFRSPDEPAPEFGSVRVRVSE